MNTAKPRAVLLSMLVAASVPAAAAIGLAPTSKWLVEFAKDDCLVSRQFGTPDQPLTIAVSPVPMKTDSTFLVLFKNGKKEFGSGKANLRFGPNDPSLGTDYFSDTLPNTGLRRIKITISDEQLALARKAGRIEIHVPDELDVALALPTFAEALKVGEQCAADLGQEWGFSAEEQARIAVAPKGEIAPVIFNDDYPREAIRHGEQGIVTARLTVDPTGKPTECIVVGSSGSRSLDAATCDLPMRRARFSPALDIDGKPVRGVMTYRIRWIQP